MADPKTFRIALEGCDDTTYIDMDLTAEELALVERIAAKSEEASTYCCMPTLSVSPHRQEARRPPAGWRRAQRIPDMTVAYPLQWPMGRADRSLAQIIYLQDHMIGIAMNGLGSGLFGNHCCNSCPECFITHRLPERHFCAPSSQITEGVARHVRSNNSLATSNVNQANATVFGVVVRVHFRFKHGCFSCVSCTPQIGGSRRSPSKHHLHIENIFRRMRRVA